MRRAAEYVLRIVSVMGVVPAASDRLSSFNVDSSSSAASAEAWRPFVDAFADFRETVSVVSQPHLNCASTRLYAGGLQVASAEAEKHVRAALQLIPSWLCCTGAERGARRASKAGPRRSVPGHPCSLRPVRGGVHSCISRPAHQSCHELAAMIIINCL